MFYTFIGQATMYIILLAIISAAVANPTRDDRQLPPIPPAILPLLADLPPLPELPDCVTFDAVMDCVTGCGFSLQESPCGDMEICGVENEDELLAWDPESCTCPPCPQFYCAAECPSNRNLPAIPPALAPLLPALPEIPDCVDVDAVVGCVEGCADSLCEEGMNICGVENEDELLAWDPASCTCPPCPQLYCAAECPA